MLSIPNLYCLFLFIVALFFQIEATESSKDASIAAGENGNGNRQARQYGYWPQSSLHRPHYDPWQIPPYYPSYQQGRSPVSQKGVAYGEASVEERQNAFGLSNINSVVNPFATFFSGFPSWFMRNPNGPNYLNMYDNCTTPSGVLGICTPASLCTGYGGVPSSSTGRCGVGLGLTVCCVNVVNKCSAQVTLNNTFWQSPSVISSETSCALTLTLDQNLVEQKSKLCQIRLDFISFEINGPNTQTVCDTDSFTVVGATNKVPRICGENGGQHMYLWPPSQTTSLQLIFNFGVSSAVTRKWNIQISLLPCGASYLAPSGCLQYITANSGTVSSFNWKDVQLSTSNTRQLANQDYEICFRSQLIGGTVANKICYTPCTTNGRSFVVSGAISPLTSSSTVTGCGSDFLLIRDGSDATNSGSIADRYCGGAFNPTANLGVSTTVCSTVRDFTIYYRTDGSETATGNLGFCLKFEQSRV